MIRYRWWPQLSGRLMAGPASGSGAGAPVSVLETRRLGNLEVTSLAASDAGALTSWLDEHGYVLRPGLGDALRPYVAEGWYYTAIRLSTDADDLSGALQPLDLRFASDELVYPMRLSAAATSSQFVRTYVFAAHRTQRTDQTSESGRLELRFAGRIEPSAVTSASLREIAEDQPYLTATDQYFGNPSAQIVSDFTFSRAPTDEPYRKTVSEMRTRTILGVPAGFLLVGLGWLAVNGIVVAALLAQRRVSERLRS